MKSITKSVDSLRRPAAFEVEPGCPQGAIWGDAAPEGQAPAVAGRYPDPVKLFGRFEEGKP